MSDIFDEWYAEVAPEAETTQTGQSTFDQWYNQPEEPAAETPVQLSDNDLDAWAEELDGQKVSAYVENYNKANPTTPITESDIPDRSGLLGRASELGHGIASAVTDRFPEDMARIYQGSDVKLKDDSIAQKIIDQQKKDQAAEVMSRQRILGDGWNKSLYEGPGSIATSAVVGGGGALVGGVSGTKIGVAVTSPTMNPAAIAAGGATGGVIGAMVGAGATTGPAFYRMAKNQFLGSILDLSKQTALTDGIPLTAQEWEQIKTDIDNEATQYGLWEAGPEALSQAFTAGLLKGVGGKVFGKIPGIQAITDKISKNALMRVGAKLTGEIAEEEATEAMTFMGQGGIEKEAGLRQTDPTLGEFVREQAGSVAVGSALQLGVHAAANRLGKVNLLEPRANDADLAAQLRGTVADAPAGDGTIPLDTPAPQGGFGFPEHDQASMDAMEQEIMQQRGTALAGEPGASPLQVQNQAEIDQYAADEEAAEQEQIRQAQLAQGIGPRTGEVPGAEVNQGRQAQELLYRAGGLPIPEQDSGRLALPFPDSIDPNAIALPYDDGIVDAEMLDEWADEIEAPAGAKTAIPDRSPNTALAGPVVDQALADAEDKAIQENIAAAVTEAATSPANDLPEPTQAQKEAGNFKKVPIKVQGLDITIENPDGSTRSWKAPDGTEGENIIHGQYGYFNRTEGNDGDKVDVIVSTTPKKAHPVFIIDQVNPETGEFDEHKVVMGVETEQEARDLYLSNYEEGWQGLGAITQMHVLPFKKWLASGKTKKAVGNLNQDAAQGNDNASGLTEVETGKQPTIKKEKSHYEQLKKAEMDLKLKGVGVYGNASAKIVEHESGEGFGVEVTIDGNRQYHEGPPLKTLSEAQAFASKKLQEQNVGKPFWQRTKAAVASVLGMPEDKHRGYVEKALSEGKPVPAEVLADYPDLVAASGQGNFKENAIKTGIEKVKGKIAQLENEIKDWSSRVYKKNDGKVTVGDNEIEQGDTPWKPGAHSYTIGKLNEKKRAAAIANFKSQIEENYETLKAFADLSNKSDLDGFNPAVMHLYEIYTGKNRPGVNSTMEEDQQWREGYRQFVEQANKFDPAEMQKAEDELNKFLDETVENEQGSDEDESGMSLGDARKLLAELKEKEKANGRIGDDRLAKRISDVEKVIEEIKADAQHTEWWERDLTPQGRRDVMKQAGVTLPDKVLWHHISDENKGKLLKAENEPREIEAPAPQQHAKFAIGDIVRAKPGSGLNPGRYQGPIDHINTDGDRQLVKIRGTGNAHYYSTDFDLVEKYDPKADQPPAPAKKPPVSEKKASDATVDDLLNELDSQLAERAEPKRLSSIESLSEDFEKGYFDTTEVEDDGKPLTIGPRKHAPGLSRRRTRNEPLKIKMQAPAVTAAKDRVAEAGKQVSAGMKRIMELAKKANSIMGESGQVGLDLDQHKISELKPVFDEMWKEAKTEAMNIKSFVSSVLDLLGVKTSEYFRNWIKTDLAKELEKPKDVEKSGDADTIEEDENTSPDKEVDDGQETGPIRTDNSRLPEGQATGEVQGTEGGRGTESPLREDEYQGGEGESSADDGKRDEGLRGERDSDSQSLPVTDYKITGKDALGKGGPKKKYHDNVAAIRLLAELEHRKPTAEDQAILVKYVGWGGIPQAFYRPDGSVASGWESEAAELKSLLSEKDYAAARSTTQDAHYTNTAIVNGIYAGLKRIGFTGGKILEPSVGTGNFIGLMPAGIRGKSKITGVEIDPTTSKIAQHLYPKQNIIKAGFQEFTIAPNSFDAAIGNPPFGSKTLFDPNHKDLSKFSIHNFFFAKSIKALRPNGILAMVVSSAMLDKYSDAQRQWISDRAELVGAIRLPNNAFRETAGTDVTTDIIFLRKRAEDEKFINHPNWLSLGKVQGKDGVWYNINQYFIKNPEMMLGEVGPNKLFPGEVKDGVYDSVPGLLPRDGVDIEQALSDAINTLPESIYVKGETFEAVQRPDIIVSDVGFAQPFGYTLDDNGQAVRRHPDVNGQKIFEPVLYAGKPIDGVRLERFKGLLKIRDAVRRLIRSELADDKRMPMYRKALNEVYDKFVAQYGYISENANNSILADDPTDLPLLMALENKFNKGISPAVAKKTKEKVRPPSAEKAAIFRERTREPYRAVTSAKDAKEALAVVLREDGAIDIDRMARLTGQSAESILKDLEGLVFKNPETGQFETADTYLSGNVKKKLAKAKQSGPEYAENVKALEAVQPEDVPPELISFHIGSTWVPTSIYEAFAREVLDNSIKINYREDVGVWSFDVETMYSTRFDTERMDGVGMFKTMLQNKDIAIYDPKTDTEPRRFNLEATTIAKAKGEDMDRAFSEWVLSKDSRREQLAKEFNEKVNTTVEGKYDGSHMIFPGMGIVNPGVKRDDQLRYHQKNVVWRLIQKGKGLLDHVVGSGKTFASITVGMEMKRMGLLKKPLYVVPNHLVQQWATDFQRLYPGANVLTIGKKDFEKSNRQQFMGRIATGTWDAVLMAHSSFGFIPSPAEFEMKFYRDQLHQYEAAIRELSAAEGKRSRSVKQMENAKDRLEEKMKALADKPKDTTVDFSELGVDALFVDEAHEFKNLMYATSRTRIAGLGNTQGSQKAFDMFVKTQYIQEMNNGRGVFFMTGTPVSNSIAEMYTMMRYMDYGMLKDLGIKHFDQWSAMFARINSDWEIDPTGTRNRLQAKLDFVNVPGLLSLYKDFADVVSTSDLQKWAKERGEIWKIPPVKGGKPAMVIAERSKLQENFMEWIVHRMDNMPQDPRIDNPLKATGQAMKAALDIRLIIPSLPDHPDSKVNLCVNKVVETYKKWNTRKGTQLIFCDLSVPKSGRSKQQSEIAELQAQITAEQAATDADAGRSTDKLESLIEKMNKYSYADIIACESEFSVYDDVKQKLIKKGLKESEVAFIHDAKTDKQKEDLFGRVRSGQVRVLIGSTAKMGAGMNVQNKLVALHHLDAPWRPSDLEQREGRIIRQGNEFFEESLKTPDTMFEVEINRYGTKETLDTRRWQVIERKAKNVSQLRSGGTKWGDTIEDATDEATNAADMKAAVSGNPLVLKEIQLRQKIRKLEALQKGQRSEKFRFERALSRAATFENEMDGWLSDIEKDKKRIARNPKDDSPQGWNVVLNGKTFKAEGLMSVPEAIEEWSGTDEALIQKIVEDGNDFDLTKDEVAAQLEEFKVELAKETKANKKAISAAIEHNKKALTEAKQRLATAVDDVIKNYIQKDGNASIEYRGFVFEGLAAADDGFFITPYTDYANYHPFPTIWLSAGEKTSPTGFPVRLGNAIALVDKLSMEVADILKKGTEEVKREADIARAELAKIPDGEIEIESARAEHASVIAEINAAKGSGQKETPDFSMWQHLMGNHAQGRPAPMRQDPAKNTGYHLLIGDKFVPAPKNAKKIDIVSGVDAFISKGENSWWAISEANTGMGLNSTGKTQAEAIANFRKGIERLGGEDKFRTLVADAIATSERSPWRPGGETKYSVAPLSPESGITLKDVKAMFPKHRVADAGDGTFSVSDAFGNSIDVKAVDHIGIDEAAFEIAYRRKPNSAEKAQGAVGSYQNGTIRISRKGDRWTLAHEHFHYLEDAGLINVMDIAVLNTAIRKAGTESPTSEDRAKFVEEMRFKRDTGGRLKIVFQKIADLIDGFVNLFHRTARGIVRDIESGAIGMGHSRQAAFQFAQEEKYKIAYHGTPHVWPPEPGFPHGRPRLDKIGTGEGAAAYGWGFYTAEAESVGKGYANTLGVSRAGKATIWKADGVRVVEIAKKIGVSEKDADRLINARMMAGNWIQAERGLQNAGVWSESMRPLIDALYHKKLTDHYDQLGEVYKLDIPDAVIPKLLDWDKPLSEQSDYVKEKIEPFVKKFEAFMSDTQHPVKRNMANGQDFYSWLSSTGNDGFGQGKVGASLNLARAGIPGNRYLDGMSRGKGEGTYNYVIWDQKTLDQIALLERNGEKLDAIREAEKENRFTKYAATNPRTADPFAEENKRLREQDKTLWEKAGSVLKRQFAPGGLLPDIAFQAKIERDTEFNVVEFDTEVLVGGFEKAVKSDYGKEFQALPFAKQKELANALAGKVSADILDKTKTAIAAMRRYIDNLSKEYGVILFNQIKQLAQEGNDEVAAAKIDLLNTIIKHIGVYVHRSYRAFDDKNWFKKVPTEIVNDARLALRREYMDKGETLEDADILADRTINKILKTGTAYDSIEAFIKESKLGAKDLSVLKHKKDISPEIRALLGEHIDPRVNFAKSATKMGRLVWNQRFLDKIRESGMGVFLFEEENAPAGATTKMAPDQSETYSPLNGLWTSPEIAQAFKDALGKEDMPDWFQTIVQINGAIKFGKTVLSPTTAMRNWQSAMFFALANGHFNMTHLVKSVTSLQEYFSTGGDAAKLDYLRKLKKLGVVYDSPYAGEMMSLLADSRMADDLIRGTGRRTLKKMLNYAQKFYQFGDDFWKIIGFENEKTAFIRTGMDAAEAEKEAAERIRNTYPTYSMVGMAINKLRRFPLVGTFVSFPAEIIRTQANMLRYVAKDFKTPGRKKMALRRMAGMAISAAAIYALQGVSRTILGIDDDEDEATRKLAAPWQRNANLWYFSREKDGTLRYIDLTFLDPYGYWKRPITAILRNQPWEQKAADVAAETLGPFLGTDILAGALFEAFANKRMDTGTKVYRESDYPTGQAVDIASHLAAKLQPGIMTNVMRTYKAIDGQVSPSGKKYSVHDEMLAAVGWRATTADPKIALYYRTFEFNDAKKDASSGLYRVLRDKNEIGPDAIREAYAYAGKLRKKAYDEMAGIVHSAKKSGMTDPQIIAVLRTSGISKVDIIALMKGDTAAWRMTPQTIKDDVRKSEALFKTGGQTLKRYQQLLEISKR